MKNTYKNKRDFYKAEAEALRIRAELAEQRLRELQNKKPTEIQRYSATVYCQKCQRVENVLIPQSISIYKAYCISCKTEGLLLPVSYYPNRGW